MQIIHIEYNFNQREDYTSHCKLSISSAELTE